MNKIVNYKDLTTLIKKIKLQNLPLVLVGGCFDILHLGHVSFLKEAKKHGALLVALESDDNLKKYKGLSRPIHNQSQRAEVLAELSSVDYIILLPEFKTDGDYEKLTKQIKPETIAVTAGDPLLKNKQQQAKSVSGKIVLIPKIQTPSSSQLIKLLKIETI